MMLDQTKNSFPSEQLVNWFEANQRSLPWRKAYDPYHVWISEIMAQQTRIDQMLPYYDRFLKQFPTVKKLADADEQTVLKSWEGLGYYSRARNLHHAAKQIAYEQKGKLPQTRNELLELKGFGPYISAAVASIAFNEDVPVVDGNVLRVTSRYWGIQDDISKPQTRKKIEGLLQEVIPSGKARPFNQGLMELGALVCTPDSPSCAQCPLKAGCFAFQNNQQDVLPVKAKKKKAPTKHFAMIVLEKEGKWGLLQRQSKLLKGMWEFPTIEFKPLQDSIAQIEEKFKKEGVDVQVGKNAGIVSHAYSHFSQEVHVFYPKRIGNVPVEWISTSQLEQRPLSKIQLKVFDFIRAG